MRVTMLGCGTSSGVPLPALGWGRCDPNEPKNRRRRVSLLIEENDTTILIDTSPDCREQLLDAGVKALDAILYTHSHADHCHGIDDIRWVNVAMKRSIPCYGDARSLGDIKKRFGYAFNPPKPGGFFHGPSLIPHEIENGQRFRLGGTLCTAFFQTHGKIHSVGYRLGDASYSTDVNELDEHAFAVLEGTKVWIVDCLSYKPHPTHSHLERTLSWIERVKPERAVLTHMNAFMDYQTLRAELPAYVEPGYDGLQIEL